MNKTAKFDKKNLILFILLTFPFFQIGILEDNISWVGKVYTGLQLIAGVVLILFFIKERLFKKLSPLIIMIGALLFVMCLASVVSGEGVKRSLEYAFGIIIIFLIIEYGILKDLKSFLLAEMIFFGSLVFINFITTLIFKAGMYYTRGFFIDNWFLGFKSGHIVYQIAFIFFAVMFAELFSKKARYVVWAGLVISIISNIRVKSLTSVIVLVPILIIALLPQILKFTPIMNILTYTGIGLALNLVFVVFRRLDLFEWLIVGIFHKRGDLTFRTVVWDGALEAIKQKPLIGHGYNTYVYSTEVVTTHNEYLEILYKAGIVGLVIFIAILAITVYKLFKNRKDSLGGWISLFLGAFFLMFVVEQYSFAFFIFILIFAWRIPDLRRLAAEQESERLSRGSGPGKREIGRTGKSARNFVFSIFANVTAILVGLVAQKLFINILGLEYAGINGLFTNVITMLGIVDLGIGEAVIFHLYRPIKENDEVAIKSLMRFYRRAFHIIGVSVAVIGACLIPALPYIAGTTQANVNLTIVYLVFLADVVFSYFLSYKRAILYADQKNFLISMIHMAYLVGMNLAQLLVLYFTHDYYAYILVKLGFRVLENVVITAVANKSYPFLKEKDIQPLKPEVKADIKKKVGALFFHKIGTFVVMGTDNILISMFFGLTTTGLYSNYYLVIDAATKLFNPAMAALTPSVGNMLVTDSEEKRFEIFRRIRFMNFWIAAFAATMLFTLIQPFVGLWFGEQYLLSMLVVIMISFQFFQALMRSSYNVFQDAAGIFYENRFVPLFESAVNIIASIILLKLIGLAGVFAGTVVSSLALWGFSYPRYVYTRLFKRKVKNYVAETLGYLGAFLVICAASYGATYFLNSVIDAQGIVMLILDALVCALISNGVLALMFFKHDCMKYFLSLVKRVL